MDSGPVGGLPVRSVPPGVQATAGGSRAEGAGWGVFTVRGESSMARVNKPPILKMPNREGRVENTPGFMLALGADLLRMSFL